MRSVLDTSVLIGSTLERLEGEFTISVVSMAELQFGVLIVCFVPSCQVFDARPSRTW